MYSNELICNILNFIEININKKISIEEISLKFFYNRYYVMKLFKKELNISLISYINNPSEFCDLILSVVEPKIDDKSEIVKLIKEKGKIFEVVDPDKNEWETYVRKYVTENLKVKINNDALIELCDRTQMDVMLLQNNAKKLALYTNTITYDDVCKMVQRPLEDNAFQLFNHLVNKNNAAALSLYKDLRVNNVEPVSLISMIANQFRVLSQVYFLNKTGMSHIDIAKELNINVYRAQILTKNCFTFSEKAINETLEALYNLDLQIKSGQVDRFYAFEMFLINFGIE
jgi:DNA polymerase-3 subunit delta